jgi:hypothetical protein
VVKYCCGVVVNYNSDTFSGRRNAMNGTKAGMNCASAAPSRWASLAWQGRDRTRFISCVHHKVNAMLEISPTISYCLKTRTAKRADQEIRPGATKFLSLKTSFLIESCPHE